MKMKVSELITFLQEQNNNPRLSKDINWDNDVEISSLDITFAVEGFSNFYLCFRNSWTEQKNPVFSVTKPKTEL
jgi:hypothetical protein